MKDRFPHGNVEKNRQRRSRHFAVLTYYEYAPLVKMATALLERPFERLRACFFEHSLSLMLVIFPGAFMGHGHEIFNRPILKSIPAYADAVGAISKERMKTERD